MIPVFRLFSWIHGHIVTKSRANCVYFIFPEQSVYLGARSPPTPQIFGHGRRPSQRQERVLLLALRLADGTKTPGGYCKRKNPRPLWSRSGSNYNVPEKVSCLDDYKRRHMKWYSEISHNAVISILFLLLLLLLSYPNILINIFSSYTLNLHSSLRTRDQI